MSVYCAFISSYTHVDGKSHILIYIKYETGKIYLVEIK